jgi:hypothetical protein
MLLMVVDRLAGRVRAEKHCGEGKEDRKEDTSNQKGVGVAPHKARRPDGWTARR